MNPIIENLCNNTLPEDKNEERLVRIRSPMYTIENDILYRISYYGSLMYCVVPTEAEIIIEKVHSGSCALHSGYKTIASKIMRLGHIWPTLYRDVAKIVKRCKSFQRHAPQNRKSMHDMIPINSPWPFYKWEIDIVGPFPTGAGNVKFLFVSIDYFTKWVEAKALRTITGVQVPNFVWEYIICRL
ncbi:uncharacterized protein [Rutidosis leptorrhynchoides]|uniref:uncharacterized protein n=1 Tax=Rutidosis leptorrhynchoides TaxID=125765 RepID=UPI003A98F473